MQLPAKKKKKIRVSNKSEIEATKLKIIFYKYINNTLRLKSFSFSLSVFSPSISLAS